LVLTYSVKAFEILDREVGVTENIPDQTIDLIVGL
jgi:hypothetical protein